MSDKNLFFIKVGIILFSVFVVGSLEKIRKYYFWKIHHESAIPYQKKKKKLYLVKGQHVNKPLCCNYRKIMICEGNVKEMKCEGNN